MKEKSSEFVYKICGLDKVIDEKGSAFIALRNIAWNCSDEEPDPSKIKLDIRKYYSSADGEKMSKGVSFLTDEGPHELVYALLEENYGDTKKCIDILRRRLGFKDAIVSIYSDEDNNDNDSKFYDPRDLILGDD